MCDSIVANFNVDTPLTEMALFDMNLIWKELEIATIKYKIYKNQFPPLLYDLLIHIFIRIKKGIFVELWPYGLEKTGSC